MEVADGLSREFSKEQLKEFPEDIKRITEDICSEFLNKLADNIPEEFLKNLSE